MLRRRDASATPSRSQAAVAAVAATVLLLATAGDAFVSVSQPSKMATSPSVTLRADSPAIALTPFAAKSTSSAVSVANIGASIALLCLAAAASRPSKEKKVASVRCTAVIGYKNEVHAAPVAAPTAAPVMSMAVPEMEPLVDLESVEIEQAVQQVVQRVFNTAPVAPVVVAPKIVMSASPAPEAASFSKCGPQPKAARFVGGARQSGFARHSSRTARASSTARKAVGSKLMAPAVPQVYTLSYDASKVSGKIQLGVRIACRISSERGRESKTQAALDGSDMSTGLQIQANEMRSWFNFHSSDTHDTTLLPKHLLRVLLLQS
eukprot:TRINITY_DN5659_c0_g1_i1.p1 TRINITY_DN5659_c0_g1~~TRINITY_DN5659_c0_g1_i1.p1  ORF type:complete len:321 (+),score=74.03 TRINITY_DN5659_c0_g1_i1:168-1130(+)